MASPLSVKRSDSATPPMHHVLQDAIFHLSRLQSVGPASGTPLFHGGPTSSPLNTPSRRAQDVVAEELPHPPTGKEHHGADILPSPSCSTTSSPPVWRRPLLQRTITSAGPRQSGATPLPSTATGRPSAPHLSTPLAGPRPASAHPPRLSSTFTTAASQGPMRRWLQERRHSGTFSTATTPLGGHGGVKTLTSDQRQREQQRGGDWRTKLDRRSATMTKSFTLRRPVLLTKRGATASGSASTPPAGAASSKDSHGSEFNQEFFSFLRTGVRTAFSTIDTQDLSSTVSRDLHSGTAQEVSAMAPVTPSRSSAAAGKETTDMLHHGRRYHRGSASASASASPSASHCSEASASAFTPAPAVERLKERGNASMQRDEFGEAIVAYTEAIRLQPFYAGLWCNRASAYLLTHRYVCAVADSLYVLYWDVDNAKAHWLIAKGYAASLHLMEAKRYYQLAKQVGERVSRRGSSAGMQHSLGDTMDSQRSLPTASSSHARQVKGLRDRNAIIAEEASLEWVDIYWQHLRHDRWTEAVQAMEKAITVAGHMGPNAVPWQLLRLEAVLHTDRRAALAEVEELHRANPMCMEACYLYAKAIFYSVHDNRATSRALELLRLANIQRAEQNRLLEANVRFAVSQLQESSPMDASGQRPAALQMDAWLRTHRLQEDSRATQLRQAVQRFARLRDEGNSAYERGDWSTAFNAYTRCLQIDPQNRSLMATIYCNRSAVCMQSGRWEDALSDAQEAIGYNPQNATAYARRGRVQLHLLVQQEKFHCAVLARSFSTPWATAVTEQMMRYADAAVADLTTAVQLAPTAEHKSQLEMALEQRKGIRGLSQPHNFNGSAPFEGTQASSTPQQPPPPKASERQEQWRRASSPPSSQGSPFHAQSRSRSSRSGLMEKQLRLLGLDVAAASSGGGQMQLKVISKAYREAALQWHPDKWVTGSAAEQEAAERQFKAICSAYHALREMCG